MSHTYLKIVSPGDNQSNEFCLERLVAAIWEICTLKCEYEQYKNLNSMLKSSIPQKGLRAETLRSWFELKQLQKKHPGLFPTKLMSKKDWVLCRDDFLHAS